MEEYEYSDVFDETPCEAAVVWLETQPDLATAWENCDNGDWLWWSLCESGNVPPKEISVAFAEWCADRVEKYADAARYAAYAVAAARADADAARYAYYAAARAARVAAYAAAAVAYTAARYAYYAADAAERLEQASWIRSHVECPWIEVSDE